MSSASLKFKQMSSSNKKSKQTATAASVAGRKENTSNKVVTEEELLKKDLITPDDVCALASITKGYLCSPHDNIYDIEFTRFKIRDMDSSNVLFEIVKCATPNSNSDDEKKKKDKKTAAAVVASTTTPTGHDSESIVTIDNYDRFANYGRFVRYNFTRKFLKLKTVGARWVEFDNVTIFKNTIPIYFSSLEFKVGSKAINSFKMIERHFFNDILIKTFKFDFGFCIPNSANSCEHIYEFPTLSQELCELYDE